MQANLLHLDQINVVQKKKSNAPTIYLSLIVKSLVKKKPGFCQALFPILLTATTLYFSAAGRILPGQ